MCIKKNKNIKWVFDFYQFNLKRRYYFFNAMMLSERF